MPRKSGPGPARCAPGAAADIAGLRFASKEQARQWAWDRLQSEGLARFPFPPHGRIPNFAGAEVAAARLFEQPPWCDARAIKVNPDSPQLHVRRLALERGVRVYVPTPKLAGGFNLLDPARIPSDCYAAASALNTMARWAQPVALDRIEALDAIVTGCAAVTPGGKRCGKGAGYSDLEYAILRELGHPPVPVATTVHDVQVVADFPVDSNDLPLALICTPTRTLRVADPLPAPEGVEWHRLNAADLAAMPVLGELRALRGGAGGAS
ncbi:MAG: 5-formyltetrahydrofolate cyclo-ligase [Pseudomonadales bacterium]